MNEKPAMVEGTARGPAQPHRVDAYQPWEAITRNEPNLSSIRIREPLIFSMVTGPGPALGAARPENSDLTTNAGTGQEAMGQRIIVTGRVLDEAGKPVPGALIEIRQANAAGRYTHDLGSWNAPHDPNFVGRGHCLSDEQGMYRFLTVRPGAYPWKVETNEWRTRCSPGCTSRTRRLDRRASGVPGGGAPGRGCRAHRGSGYRHRRGDEQRRHRCSGDPPSPLRSWRR